MQSVAPSPSWPCSHCPACPVPCQGRTDTPHPHCPLKAGTILLNVAPVTWLVFILPLQSLCFLWIHCTENWAHSVINITEYSTFPHENAVCAVLQFHTVTFVAFKQWTALVDTNLHHVLSCTRKFSFDLCREYISTKYFSLNWQNFPPF